MIEEFNLQIYFSILFHHQGYRRIGPYGATCVDGVWSPKDLPECVPGKHPGKVYIFRGKRSVDGNIIEEPHLEEQSDNKEQEDTKTKIKDVAELTQYKSKIKLTKRSSQYRYQKRKAL